MLEDLRGVFFIIKGQYRRGIAPSFFNTYTESEQWLGGYNPETTTTEWYMLLDRLTWTVHYASSEYEKVLASRTAESIEEASDDEPQEEI